MADNELIRLEGLEVKDPKGRNWKPETKKKKAKQRDVFIAKLEKWREFNHLTVRELCFILDIKECSYLRWRSGKTLPTSATLKALRSAVKKAVNLSYTGATIKRDGKIITIRQAESDEKYAAPKIESEEAKIKAKPTLCVKARCSACEAVFNLEPGIKPVDLPHCPCGGVLEIFIGAT